MKDVKMISIDWTGSLYDPSSGDFISLIEDALESASPGTIVLLKANNPCHDYHRSWLEGLSGKFYWEELAEHFQRVHLALIGICVSKARWFFVSSHDCLGSWWDLALVCHGRVWANPYAKVGFPEIYIDLIPPLASGGLRRYTVYQTIDEARKNAILHAKDAYNADLISLVMQGQAWAEDGGFDVLYSWIRKTATFTNLRSTTRKELIDETPDISGIIEQRSGLQSRRRQIAMSHLESGFAALRERNIAARALTMASIRAGGAARLLFEDYRSWLSRRITRYELGAHDKWWTSGDGMLVIDMSAGVPPQSMIQTLLSRKIDLVLMSSSEDLLKEGVETVLSRSQRAGVSRKDILASWKGRIDWAKGDVREATCVWMACTGNDLVEFGLGPKVLMSRLRLAGNFGQASLGWVEALRVPAAADDPVYAEALHTITEIADMLTNGVLRRDRWPHAISLSVALRFCLLGEMIRLANSGKWPDLIDQCKLLAGAGWGFAADVPQWDGLIRGFAQDPALPEAVGVLGGKIDEISRQSSIADLRLRAPKSSNISRLEISAARLSRHFEAYSVAVVGHLVNSNAVESDAMADLFVTLAWGYPGKSPVPSELGIELGEGRIAQWLDREQPQEKITRV